MSSMAHTSASSAETPEFFQAVKFYAAASWMSLIAHRSCSGGTCRWVSMRKTQSPCSATVGTAIDGE